MYVLSEHDTKYMQLTSWIVKETTNKQNVLGQNDELASYLGGGCTNVQVPLQKFG